MNKSIDCIIITLVDGLHTIDHKSSDIWMFLPNACFSFSFRSTCGYTCYKNRGLTADAQM